MRQHALFRKAHTVFTLAREAVQQFSRDRADLLSAALAFFTLLSIAPLIIIAVAIAGAILGEGEARQEVRRLLQETMGGGPAAAIDSWVEQASRSGGVASIIGFLLLLLGASRLVAQLRSALNQIFNVSPREAEGLKASVAVFVKRRLFAFAVAAAAGPLLLLVVASRALLTGLHGVLFSGTPFAGTLVQITQLLFSIAVVALMSALVFKIVPDTRIGWRVTWVGGLVTSILFNIGNVLVGFYLGRATVSATYGAAGSAVVVLLWLYFSGQIFLFGAEFTQVYAQHFGRGLKREEEDELEKERGEVPDAHAERGFVGKPSEAGASPQRAVEEPERSRPRNTPPFLGLFVLAALALPAQACGGPTFVVQQYDGPVRPVETISILRMNGDDPAHVVTLDGEPTDVRVDDDARLHIEVLPGRHTLAVWSSEFPERRPEPVAFMAEPGRVYRAVMVSFRADPVARVYEVSRGSDDPVRDVTLPTAPPVSTPVRRAPAPAPQPALPSAAFPEPPEAPPPAPTVVPAPPIPPPPATPTVPETVPPETVAPPPAPPTLPSPT
ncbi:MAG TPA: YihY/virulence factor BrkB family protein, partial [Polyangiaceae bacterium]|nr:YihY/virulence factor BrkB family protein [Polyangiaceae bacterium]